MSTVISAVKLLDADGIILAAKGKTGTGSSKTTVNINPDKVVAGVSYFRMRLYGKLMSLDGRIMHSAEKELNEAHCDIVDSITRLIEDMLHNCYSLSAIGLSMAMSDNTSLAKVLALRFCVPVHISDSVGALAMHQRYIVKKNNANIAVLYIGRHIRCAKVAEWCENIELGNLLSPIISAQKGRLIYDEVLSVDVVKQRMQSKYGKADYMFEAAVMEPEITVYSKQLQYAIGELILLLDRTVKPSTIIVAGDYVTKDLVDGGIDSLGDTVRAEVICTGNGFREITEGACCIGLNGFLYY
ncbi:MAG: hypothetical protein EOM87_05080 [Clostridia bacterium]|nr:hypothetical protein [Clostridia bacterium]